MNVKGLIFAAGIGSRLRPITDTIPKALVTVGRVTMLERTIRRLIAAGVTDITVNVHHHAQLVKEWIAANATLLEADLHVSDESSQLLDTGGGLLKAISSMADADAILLHNVDIFTEIPLQPMIEAHLARHSELPAVTLATAARPTSRYLLFDKQQRMRGWENVSTGEVRPSGLDKADLSPLGFLGIHVLSPCVAQLLQEYAANHGEVFSLTPFYVDNTQALDIRPYSADNYTWLDVGRPETLAIAQMHVHDDLDFI